MATDARSTSRDRLRAMPCQKEENERSEVKSTKTIRMSLSLEQPPTRVERVQQEQDYAASRSGHAGCRLFFFRCKRECGLFSPRFAANDPPVEDCDRYFLRKKGTKKSCGRRPRLFLFRYKRECGGLKPLPEARAGFCANMGEHANKGEHPLFACSRVRKAGFIRPRMQNADSAHTLHLRLHFITHITWVNAPCNGCNAVKRHTLFPII